MGNAVRYRHGTRVRSKAWQPVGHIERLKGDIERMGARGDLWYGVSSRRQRLHEGRRGGASDCSYLPGLFADVDVKGEGGHKLPDLPPTEEAAITLIKRFPLPPTTVVRSGHGFQPLWHFAEAVPAVDAIELLARWALTWQRLAKELGEYRIDNVWSLDRILRLPGTGNFKE